MASNYKISYNVDLVLCIDSTGSMDNVIDIVKRNAVSFYADLMDAMSKKNKIINKLRVKIISFRDYIADGEDAMLNSDFFILPYEAESFSETVNGIIAYGGGDDPEDGLEALAYAIRSNWDTEGMKRRQVIAVWSDAATHPLGFGASSPNYPKKMAMDFNELTAWWGDRQNNGYTDYHAKRLLLFTPNEEMWSTISDNWENVIHFPSKAGNGLDNVTYSQIIDSITNTI